MFSTSRFRAPHTFISLVAVLAMVFQTADGQSNVDLPRYPSISPDGSTVAFSWRGDLWTVASRGGQAVRLSGNPFDETRSAWSPDGTRIAFNSDRSGYTNIHMMNADGTDVRQVSISDRSAYLQGFGVDEDGNEVLTFHSYLEGDLYRAPRPYMIRSEGGDLLRLHDAFGEEAVVSPDGRYVAFTRGNMSWTRRDYRGPDDRDIWLFDREDETYHQLTHWEGQDGAARWVGSDTIYFMSDRELDTANLYRMTIEHDDNNGVTASEPVRLTAFEDHDIWDFDVAANGSTAVMHVWDSLYTLDLRRADATPRTLDITASEDDADNYELKSINRDVDVAALSPDGQVMAYVAYGRVYVRNIDDHSPTRRVSPDDSHARATDLAWSPDGLTLYFVDDSDGTESIYAATVAQTRDELRESYEVAIEALEEPEDATVPEGDSDAAENDAVGTEGESRDDADEPDDDEGDDDTDDNADDESDDEEEPDPDRPDPKRWHDALRFSIEPVVQTATNDRNPSPSPCGRYLAYRSTRGTVEVLNLETNETHALLDHWDRGTHWTWSPDSRYIAYSRNNLNFSSDVWVIPVDGTADDAINITRHPRNDINPNWSADGKILSFRSNRTNDDYDVWMVYLDKSLESLNTKEREEYHKEAADAAKKRKPLKTLAPDETRDVPDSLTDDLDFEYAWQRLRRLTSLPGSQGNHIMTPGGDRYIFSARIGDESGLYSVDYRGDDRERLGSFASVQHMNLAGDRVVVVQSSRGALMRPEGGSTDHYDISDRYRIDLKAQSEQKFIEAARTLGEVFYHPTMKGLDWDGLTEEYLDLARNTRTASEFNAVAARLLGELNGSHLGISARGPTSPLRQSLGRIGTHHERVQIDVGDGEGMRDGYRITHIIPESPAATATTPLDVGDVISHVDFVPFGPTDTVESLLQDRSGEEVALTIHRHVDSDNADNATIEFHTLLTPVSWGAQRGLIYEAWQERNRQLVAEWSDGRIGYAHIQGMNQPSLDEFVRDLYAAAYDRDALIIDVRNNGGGWTTDRVLASIMVQPHAYTVPRGADVHDKTVYPQDRLFIPRYVLPINMLCNEKSFSNAEIISHAFKTLERGTLVGQQTAGGVISTGGTTLIDGTRVRLPFRGWYVMDGTDMENNGAVPDILVPQTPEDESRDYDEQLKAAVDDLLGRLDDQAAAVR